MTDRSPLWHARDLLKRGLLPVPVPYKKKAAVLDAWQNLRLSADDLPHFFKGKKGNIGVLWGEPSGYVIDVDLDHPRAVELADHFLPATGLVWGRNGKPRSHRLYRLTHPADTKKWPSKTAGMIVEFRSTGTQSLAPGSTHPSGESVRWDDEGEPATVDPSELIRSLERLADQVLSELGETREAPRKPTRPRTSTTSLRNSNYGREALRREAQRVAATPEGSRNDALNQAAFSIGTLVGSGDIDHQEVESALLAAAQSSGLSANEAHKTIHSGLNAGKKQPRQHVNQSTMNTQQNQQAIAVHTTEPFPSSVPVFAPISARDLIRENPNLRAIVIADLLREGETMNIVAAPKVGKSWLVHALAISVVSGQPWLGKATTKGDVLLVDGELHRATLAYRLHTTQTAMGVDGDDCSVLDVWPVRGQRLTIEAIAIAFEAVPAGKYRLIILDALYRFLPLDGEENANETMTKIYNTLDEIASRTGSSIAVVHHATKGNQSEKAVTDVGSGAGAQSRAADTHLVLRQHESDDAVVVDAVVRSFPPLQPFVIRSNKPGWSLAPDLDPTHLKRTRRHKDRPDSPTSAKKSKRDWTPEEFATEVVGRSMSIRADVIARSIELGLSKAQASDLLKRAIAAGKVHKHQKGPSEPQCFSTDAPSPIPDTG